MPEHVHHPASVGDERRQYEAYDRKCRISLPHSEPETGNDQYDEEKTAPESVEKRIEEVCPELFILVLIHVTQRVEYVDWHTFLSENRVGFRQDAILVHKTEITGVVTVFMLSHDEHDPFGHRPVVNEVLQRFPLQRGILCANKIFSVAVELLLRIDGKQLPFVAAENFHDVLGLFHPHTVGEFPVPEQDVITPHHLVRISGEPVDPVLERRRERDADLVGEKRSRNEQNRDRQPEPPVAEIKV